MMVRHLPIISIILFSAVAMAEERSDGAGRVTLKATEQGWWFSEAGRKVAFYQQQPKSLDGRWERANYLHPVYDLDGEPITEDFPEDHRHHRGVFWAWHQLLVGDKQIGDGWVAKDFSWDVEQTKTERHEDGSATLHVTVIWRSPQWADEQGREKPLVREMTAIRIYPGAANHRLIDFEIRLLALEENLRIGGSDDAKGYGGFSPRIRMPEDARFVGRDGEVEPQRTAVSAGPWIDISGHFGAEDKVQGVAILAHPSLPEYPPPWILRRQRSMQNAVFPGREPRLLSTTDPLTLRYRLVIHQGDAKAAEVDRLHEQYERIKP